MGEGREGDLVCTEMSWKIKIYLAEVSRSVCFQWSVSAIKMLTSSKGEITNDADDVWFKPTTKCYGNYSLA